LLAIDCTYAIGLRLVEEPAGQVRWNLFLAGLFTH